MKHAILVFKCRRCHTVFEGQHATPDFTWWMERHHQITKHKCEKLETRDEERIGLADLIGWNVRDIVGG